MISRLEIHNFKCHKSTQLELGKLNLLAGLNGMGKSTTIQALLLLRQSLHSNTFGAALNLNGNLCNIGNAEDAIYQYADTNDISFVLEQDDIKANWLFRVDDSRLDATAINAVDGGNANQLERCSLFSDHFQYISSFRNGPERNNSKPDTTTVEVSKQISAYEGRCESTAHFLYHFKDKEVPEALCHPQGKSNTLLFQVEAWLQEISPYINLHIEQQESGFRISFSYSRGQGLTKTSRFKPMNIGFGVSYVLPILVAVLHAKPGAILLIENPESHIHPAGQSKLMELMCRAAKQGVQFFIETHSDHIVNGLLVALKKDLLNADEAAIYFFDKDHKEHAAKAYQVLAEQNGRIKKAPNGFFDQIGKDLHVLLSRKP